MSILKKRYHLYREGNYFHGAFDTISDAIMQIVCVEDELNMTGECSWTIRDTQENETQIRIA